MASPESTYKYHLKVVATGGGTGLHHLLRGLVKVNQPDYITATPGTWDSGGSSGRARVRQGVLPPGDYMQSVVALMEDDKQYEEALRLLRHREGSEDDPLVNLFATRAEKIYHGVEGGIDALRRLFLIRGKVIPITLVDTDLIAETKNGKILAREHVIDEKKNDLKFSMEDEVSRIYLETGAPGNPKALDAIMDADLIIFSPGSPYTSRYAHLLAEGVVETIMRSSADLCFVQNIWTTPGEDHHLTLAAKQLEVFQYYLGDLERIKMGKISRINYFIPNNTEPDPEIIELYRAKNQRLVIFDEKDCKIQAPGMRIVHPEGPIAGYDLRSHLYRHSEIPLAEAILSSLHSKA